jgi:hypothetical protein
MQSLDLEYLESSLQLIHHMSVLGLFFGQTTILFAIFSELESECINDTYLAQWSIFLFMLP